MNDFRTWYSTQPPALRALLTINVVFYVLWLLVLGRIPATQGFVSEHLALHAYLPQLLFEPWQLVTYNFLHLGGGIGGFLHILFNMLWLYWIGKGYEQMHGAAQLMAVYLLAGIGGGLLTLAATPLLGPSIVYGASASVIGVITVVAVRYPYKKIRLFLLGTWRLIHLVIGFLVLDIIFITSSNTAVAAHLGGALFGFLFVKGEERGIDLSSWARIFFQGRKRTSRHRKSNMGWLDRIEAWLASQSPSRRKSEEQKDRSSQRTRSSEKSPAANNASSGEVDRILDKISEQGYEALTEEEKRILYEASRR